MDYRVSFQNFYRNTLWSFPVKKLTHLLLHPMQEEHIKRNKEKGKFACVLCDYTGINRIKAGGFYHSHAYNVAQTSSREKHQTVKALK